MTKDIKTGRRWLRSVIAASAEPLPTFPWMRGERKRPVLQSPAVQTLDGTESRDRAMQQHGKGLFGGRGAMAAR